MIIQQQVLAASRQADQETPSRCQTNRVVDCFQHTSRVLALLGQPWAYIGKRDGEGKFSPPGFAPRPMTGSDGQTYTITGVSHDAITNGVLQFDLLGAGNDGPEPLGQPAIPQALEIPPQFHRPGNPPVAYPLNGVVVPPVPPVAGAPAYPDENTFWKAFQERMRKAYSDAGRTFPDPNDPDAFRRFSRCGFDIGRGADPMKSADKHISELRAELGV